MATGRGRRFWLIGSLYVSQAVPLGFFAVALPAILRSQGTRLEWIGLVGVLALPWLLKWMWAPFVDAWGGRAGSRFGHYRSWLIPLQLGSVLAVCAIAFLRPDGDLLPLLLAGAAFMVFSATQDIAADGLAVRLLGSRERGAGNGIQVGGYYLGQILGGGAVLILFGRYGWSAAMIAMAVLLGLPLLPLLGFREPPRPTAAPERPDFQALGRFMRRPGNGGWLLVLMLYRGAEQMALVMLNPMLVDRGWSLDEVGLLLGLAVSVGAMGGAVAGGLLVNPLGRKTSLVVFGLIQTVCLGGLLLPASGIGGAGLVWVVTTCSAFAGGMATAALYTNMMDRCGESTGGTDFSLQQALAAVGPIVAAGLGGFSAAHLGYAGHFAVATAAGLGTVLIVARWLVADEPAECPATVEPDVS